MCEYCSGANGKILLERKFLDDFDIILSGKITKREAKYDNYIIYIDRGYLRLVDEKENQCLGHGLKKKLIIALCVAILLDNFNIKIVKISANTFKIKV